MSTKQLKTVWVVDDDVSICWVLEKALSKKGYKVEVFRSVKPLLQALKNHKPDVVLSDIQMPGVDGIKLLELLHTNFPQIPVIIMTAYADYETTISSYKKGAFEYLSKPFDIHKVQATVASALKSIVDDNDEFKHVGQHSWKATFSVYLDSIISSENKNISKKLYQEIDKMLITTALKATDGHKQNAAKILGWGRNTLTRKMADLGL